LLFRAFANKVDNVITLPPYGMYGVLANINAVENREILLSQDFQPQIDNILKLDANTKMIFFVHQTIQQEFIYDESIVTLLKILKD
jgi:histidinol-phosphate aminotransferase